MKPDDGFNFQKSRGSIMHMPWAFRMTLTVALFAFPLFLYVGLRTRDAVRFHFPQVGKTAALLILLVIVWIYCYPLSILWHHWNGTFHQLFALKHETHWPDYLLLYPFWWGFTAIVETVFYFILLDLGTLLYAIIKRIRTGQPILKKKETGGRIMIGDPDGKSRRWYRFQNWAKVFVVCFFVVYTGVMIYLNTHTVDVNRREISIPGLPSELKNFKICFLSDIHADRYTGDHKLSKVKKAIAAGTEDLYLFAGDLISRGEHFIPHGLDNVCPPGPNAMKVAVMGDHDHWYGPERIPAGLKACGWDFLEDKHLLMMHKKKRILITGITYIYSQRISESGLEKLLADAPSADLKILLVHQPREFLIHAAEKYGYHLLLGGHTHGGQLVNHILGVPVTPNLTETSYYRGHYRYNDLNVYVTNGIGLTLAPIRYHAQAEIAILELK